MSTASEEQHRSHAVGHTLMALVALALALTAAYLWLSDGNLSWRFTLEPPATPAAVATPVVAASIVAPVDQSVTAPSAMPAPPRPLQPAARSAPVSAMTQTAPADQPVTVDAQVAADAAAVGMTTRVRPSEPATPGQ